MSKANVSAETTTAEKTETVEETKVEETVKEKVDAVVEAVKDKVEKTPVVTFSAETQKMNAKQFFDTYPHDNKAVVALIIMLYGNKTKTVAEWEAFYQQMLKKKVN